MKVTDKFIEKRFSLAIPKDARVDLGDRGERSSTEQARNRFAGSRVTLRLLVYLLYIPVSSFSTPLIKRVHVNSVLRDAEGPKHLVTDSATS